MVEYTYDSWGKPLSCTGTLATTLGVLNPFRYRGYVYDEETQWYYLKSRYYDPETCRFISADVYLSTGQGVIGHNAFVYSLNNPINCFDDEGEKTRFVAIGVQLQITIGSYQIGIEIVRYVDSEIKGAEENPWQIYVFDGAGISEAELLSHVDIAKVMLAIETTRVPSTMEKAGLVVLQAELSKELGASLSVFGIFGYDNFNSVDSYCGGFKTVTANIKHAQGYYSWSDTCSVVGVGATVSTSLQPFGASFSATNYMRLEFKN